MCVVLQLITSVGYLQSGGEGYARGGFAAGTAFVLRVASHTTTRKPPVE